MSDPKVFGKIFKSRLLDSIINDPNYIVNNAYDYIYKLKNYIFGLKVIYTFYAWLSMDVAVTYSLTREYYFITLCYIPV